MHVQEYACECGNPSTYRHTHAHTGKTMSKKETVTAPCLMYSRVTVLVLLAERASAARSTIEGVTVAMDGSLETHWIVQSDEGAVPGRTVKTPTPGYHEVDTRLIQADTG